MAVDKGEGAVDKASRKRELRLGGKSRVRIGEILEKGFTKLETASC